MTAESPRPPILVIRGDANFVGTIELFQRDQDGDETLVASREGPRAGGDLAALVAEIAASGTGFHDVIVDLEPVQWLNSTGLGWLVGLSRQRKLQGDTVALAGANERIIKLLHVTSLDLVLPLHATVAEAARALRDGGEDRSG
jgi:anti-anti-sigma factor